MIVSDIQICLKMKKKDWLGTEKHIKKCGKTLHNNLVIHHFFNSFACSIKHR